MKTSDLTEKQIRLRLMKSVILGLLFFIFMVMVFLHIRHGPQNEGTSSLLRSSFRWNEEVTRILFSSKRMSVNKNRPPEGTQPRFNGNIGLKSNLPEKYSIEVISGKKNLHLPVAAFKLLPKSEYSTDFRCIEGWSEVVHYGGPKFSEFMKFYNLGKKQDGSYYGYVGLETPDKEYYVSVDMESMLHDQTVLAYEMNGKRLSVEHGAPLRLIIPIKYGIKSLKRIGKIFFSDIRPPDYWAERGYDWYSGL